METSMQDETRVRRRDELRPDRRRPCDRSRAARAMGIVLAAWMLAVPVHASVVAPVALDEMLDHCALVFRGSVVESWSEASTAGIHTWVSFRVERRLSGRSPDTITLRFRGGRAGDRVEEVAGSPIPVPGERGIYFVESLDRFLVNPLYGWHQGRLRIVRGRDGRERVATSRGHPVVAIGSAGTPRTRSTGLRPEEESAEVAAGVTSDAGAEAEQALSVDRVEAALAARLEALR